MAAGGGTVVGRAIGGTDSECRETEEEGRGREDFEGDGGRGVSIDVLLI